MGVTMPPLAGLGLLLTFSGAVIALLFPSLGCRRLTAILLLVLCNEQDLEYNENSEALLSLQCKGHTPRSFLFFGCSSILWFSFAFPLALPFPLFADAVAFGCGSALTSSTGGSFAFLAPSALRLRFPRGGIELTNGLTSRETSGRYDFQLSEREKEATCIKRLSKANSHLAIS